MKFFSLSCMTPIIFNLFLSGSKKSVHLASSFSQKYSRRLFCLDFPRIWWTWCKSTSVYIRHFSNKLRQCLQQTNSAFTAPSTGLCVFCYTVFASGVHVVGETGNYWGVTLKLIHNDDYTGFIHVDTEANWDKDMLTGFAILVLEAGDVVFTKSRKTDQGFFRSSDIGRWSFSGFQIAQKNIF